MKSMNLTLSWIITVVFVLVLVFCASHTPHTMPVKSGYPDPNMMIGDATAEIIGSALYVCDESKLIVATYYNDYANVALSDGRSLNVPQTVSASGIRYANADESFVFWSKGPTAFVTEGDDTTYSNCVEKQ